MAFEHELRVRFHQADPAGVLFYGRLWELVEETYEVFCRAAGVDIDAAMSMRGWTTPIVHAEADYREPLRVGEAVTVRLRVCRIGRASYDLEYAFVGEHGRESAVARAVHVVVAAADWSKRSIPEDLRSRLAAWLTPDEASCAPS